MAGADRHETRTETRAESSRSDFLIRIRGESEVDASGETEMTSYTWTDVAADGTVPDTGQDVSRGTRLSVPPADAVDSPLAGVPTWMPATSATATPTG
jgi:hypothetical protein